MTNQEAKQILLCMGAQENDDWIQFDNGQTYVSVDRGQQAYLKGKFLADELEAIAQWMRDPTGVMNAGDKTP